MSPELTAAVLPAAAAILAMSVQLTFSHFGGRRKERHERQLVLEQYRRDAYLEIIAWFSHVRGELKFTVDSERRWTGDQFDERENARMDAQTELLGSESFRSATDAWGPAYRRAVDAYARLCDLREAQPGVMSRERTALAREVTSELDQLGEIIKTIRAAARSDVLAGLGVTARRGS